MDKIYFNILSGIICNIISICCALLVLLIDIGSPHFKLLITLSELYFLIVSILLFAVSVRYMSMIIKYTRYEIRKKLPSDQEVDKILEKVS